MSQRAYDDQGLIHVCFQRLPGQETNPLYVTLQTQIEQNIPRYLEFGLTRLPAIGELLRVDRFLWKVEQVIHQPVDLNANSDDVLVGLPPEVATVQVSFHAVLG